VNGDEVSRFLELGYQVVEDTSSIYKHFYLWKSSDGRVGGPMPLQGINPLNAELNPICHLLALLGTRHILHVSGLRVKYKPSILQTVASLSEMSWLIP
jgi:hypothetical protein